MSKTNETTLAVEDFKNAVFNIVDTLKKEKVSNPKKFIVSDVIQELEETEAAQLGFPELKELQYVDLVQQGGGILGYALLGYTYVMESMGIRFLNLGGTSAGAINTILMAAVDTPDKPKTEKVLEILVKKDVKEFVDSRRGRLFMRIFRAIKNTKRLSNNQKILFIPILWSSILIISPFVIVATWLAFAISLTKWKIRLGLCKGDAFESWLKEVLTDKGITNTGELIEKMNGYDLAKIVHRPKTSPIDIKADLKIIAADISTETKTVFPDMSNLYFSEEGKTIHPAVFVRASMSIPIFFRPYKIDMQPLKHQNYTKLRETWKKTVMFDGEIPNFIHFVDGGIMSNFPIDVFHMKDRIPTRPTFGVKLGKERQYPNNVNGWASLFPAMFNSSRHLRDFEFLFLNDDFRNLIAYIDTEGYDWMDFYISDEQKIALFKKGAEAADKFLRGFEWEAYKQLRRKMIFNLQVAILNEPWKPERIDRMLGLNLEQNFDNTKFKDVTEKLTPNKTQAPLKKINILWIDDNPNRDVLELYVLKSLGFNCKTVESSDKAKAALYDSGEYFDIIVSDVDRERIGEGLRFAYEISKGKLKNVSNSKFTIEQPRHQPFIFYSDRTTEDYAKLMGKAKIDGVEVPVDLIPNNPRQLILKIIEHSYYILNKKEATPKWIEEYALKETEISKSQASREQPNSPSEQS
jgi:predicted acylesterase/phospholipase RssA